MRPLNATSTPCPAAPGIARAISDEARRRRLASVGRVLEGIRQRVAAEAREKRKQAGEGGPP